MKYEIKNRFTGATIYQDEAESFSALILAAIKAKANLLYANLQYANLQYADLQYADLRSADLQYANLRYANLRYANLQSANLQYANLQSANLQYADLQYADLQSANLQYADLQSAKNVSAITNALALIVPESGSFEGWKICRDKVLVRVLIPKDAARSNATGRKCRAEKVKVLQVIGAKEGVSQHDAKVIYKKGNVVKCHEWTVDRWVECGGGIHFFITRAEAEAY
jgi:hypothetical protein